MTRQEFFEMLVKVEKDYNKLRGCSTCNNFRNCKSQNTCKIIANRKEKFEHLESLKLEYKNKFNANYDFDRFSIECGNDKYIIINNINIL
jgi:hypothetical protein